MVLLVFYLTRGYLNATKENRMLIKSFYGRFINALTGEQGRPKPLTSLPSKHHHNSNLSINKIFINLLLAPIRRKREISCWEYPCFTSAFIYFCYVYWQGFCKHDQSTVQSIDLVGILRIKWKIWHRTGTYFDVVVKFYGWLYSFSESLPHF